MICFGMLAVFVLVGCSNDEGQTSEEKHDSEMTQAKWEKEKAAEKEQKAKEEKEDAQNENKKVKQDDSATNDPVLFAEKDSDYDTFVDGKVEYTIKDIYVSDDTDADGFATIENGGFNMRLAMLVIKNQDGYNSIGIFGEMVNDSDDDYNFTDAIELKIDGKKVSDLDFDFKKTPDAHSKEKVIDYFTPNSGMPDNFTIKIYNPLYEKDKEAEPKVLKELEFHEE